MNMGGKSEDKSTNNHCAVPAVTQVIIAAKGVTDPLVQSIKKFGENNFKAGQGSDLGFGPFGHDFGSNFHNNLVAQGSSAMSGVVHKVQSCYAEVMMKFAVAQKMSSVQGILPPSVKSGFNLLNDPKDKFDNFLKNPLLNGEDSKVANDIPRQNAERLQSENLLKLVLKHQQVIEELLEENMKLREMMVEDLKISPSKLQGSSGKSTSSSAECFGSDTGPSKKV